MSVNPSRDMHRETLQGATFTATVVNNNDPERLQRLQIRVDGPLHEGVPDDHLPWGLRMGSAGRGTTGAVHEVGVPPNGSKVFVQFMDNSDDYPIILGAAHIGQPNAELTGADYTHCYGWIDEANNMVLFNTAQRTYTIHMATGAQILLDSNGGIQMLAASNTSVSVQGNLSLQASGAINIGSRTGVRLTGPYVTMSPGGSGSPATPQPR